MIWKAVSFVILENLSRNSCGFFCFGVGFRRNHGLLRICFRFEPLYHSLSVCAAHYFLINKAVRDIHLLCLWCVLKIGVEAVHAVAGGTFHSAIVPRFGGNFKSSSIL